jgi:hypothetical protein
MNCNCNVYSIYYIAITCPLASQTPEEKDNDFFLRASSFANKVEFEMLIIQKL